MAATQNLTQAQIDALSGGNVQYIGGTGPLDSPLESFLPIGPPGIPSQPIVVPNPQFQSAGAPPPSATNAPTQSLGAPITANMVTSTVLDNWMQGAIGSTMATAVQWCFAMNQVAPGACPALSIPMLLSMGMKGDGSNRSSLPNISSTQFLDAMRQVQRAAASTAQGPGGSQLNPNPGASTPGASAAAPGAGPVGQGVLGPTSCAVCQQLSSQPVLLLVLAVALYYLFVK